MNIVALATPYGVGAISIIRLSGKDALSIADKICGSLTPRVAHLKELKDRDGNVLDEAIVIYFKAPFSFTGEDVVEFQTHGGVVVANLIIDEILAYGARIADPGEFSKRALLNGKIDLAKAESIQGLINARSEGAAKILARVMSGELGLFCDTLRDELISTLAYTETCIDYADDDLPTDIMEQIKLKLKEVSSKLDHIISILNSLLNYERAIISDTPGTTRDTIEEQIKVGTHLVRIIDTAGIRHSDHDIENIGIEYSKRAANSADIIICVFDSSRASNSEDIAILDFINSLNKKVIFVLNKSDLEFKFDLDIDGILLSAKDECSALKFALESYLNSQDTNEIMLSSNRQIKACQDAKNAIDRATELLDESVLELFAYEINRAIKEIGSITKPLQNSEILDKMFSSFCLGK